MGVLRRIFVGLAFLVEIMAPVWAIATLSNGKVLGETTLINKSDSYILAYLAVLSLICTFFLILVMWRGSRRHRKLEREFAGYRI